MAWLKAKFHERVTPFAPNSFVNFISLQHKNLLSSRLYCCVDGNSGYAAGVTRHDRDYESGFILNPGLGMTLPSPQTQR